MVKRVVGNKKKGEKKYRLSLKPLATRLGEKLITGEEREVIREFLPGYQPSNN